MRSALAFWGCCTLLATLGCAMCANPHDCSYAAYGGRIQRVDRVHGRVGSILDPDAGDYSAADDASMLVPTPADEQVEAEVVPVEPIPWQPERPAPQELQEPQEPTPADLPESGDDQDRPLPELSDPSDGATPNLLDILGD